MMSTLQTQKPFATIFRLQILRPFSIIKLSQLHINCTPFACHSIDFPMAIDLRLSVNFGMSIRFAIVAIVVVP
jgi:hypothetical protein